MVDNPRRQPGFSTATGPFEGSVSSCSPGFGVASEAASCPGTGSQYGTSHGSLGLEPLSMNGSDVGIDELKNATVIMVMGPTGSGKSSFIRTATGNDDVAVGSALSSVTREVHAYRARGPFAADVDVVLVDTPGLDHTYMSDDEIVRIIMNWMEQIAALHNVHIHGVLFLMSIALNRRGNIHLNKTVSLFNAIWEPEWFHRLVLVTTFWDDEVYGHSDCQLREKHFIRNDWKEILNQGSRVIRYQNTYVSAWNAIKFLLEEKGVSPLKISPKVMRRAIDRAEEKQKREMCIRSGLIEPDGETDSEHLRNKLGNKGKAVIKKLGSMKLAAPRQFFRSLKAKLPS